MTRSATVSIKNKIRRKRRRALRRAACMAGLLTVIVLALRSASTRLLSKNIPETESTQSTHVKAASYTASNPAAERHNSQITADLKAYAKTGPLAAQIYTNRNEYPEELLQAYLNNPEMEEFAAEYPNAMDSNHADSYHAVFTSDELQQKYPLFLQWDKRWGYLPYGGSIIGLSGCGPTCLSMVLVSLTGNAEMTPAQVAQFSQENGYYVEGSGTSWSLMTDGASRLGLYARELSLDESVMKKALDNGQPVICSMGAGDFTSQGHFILIYGYNDEGFLVNDPNCIARSSRAWSFEKLHGQIKNLWSYGI